MLDLLEVHLDRALAARPTAASSFSNHGFKISGGLRSLLLPLHVQRNTASGVSATSIVRSPECKFSIGSPRTLQIARQPDADARRVLGREVPPARREPAIDRPVTPRPTARHDLARLARRGPAGIGDAPVGDAAREIAHAVRRDVPQRTCRSARRAAGPDGYRASCRTSRRSGRPTGRRARRCRAPPSPTRARSAAATPCRPSRDSHARVGLGRLGADPEHRQPDRIRRHRRSRAASVGDPAAARGRDCHVGMPSVVRGTWLSAQARILRAQLVEELEPLAERHRVALDHERRQVDDHRLVGLGAERIAAEPRGPRRDHDLVARRARWRRRTRA